MRHKEKLSDEEAKARRLESARKYREANREKTREACRLSQAKRREDPGVRAKDRVYKQDPGYRERQRQYRAENRDKLDAKTAEWREANQEQFRAYHKAYQHANRHRTIERLKNWRTNNPERNKEYARAWRKANPHLLVIKEQRRLARIKGVGGNLSPGIHKRLMHLQKGLCIVCRTSLKEVRPHLDHIMPIAKGGANTDDNVQLLCPTCNLKKNSKHPVDFMQERGFFVVMFVPSMAICEQVE
jgi:5-methylcytosine-specific restriction endonuclease McrA